MALKKKEDALNENEVSAIQQEEKREEESGATTERLTMATRIISQQFGLDESYHVSKFNDKGKVVDLTLENEDFIVAVTIKNSEAKGMVIDQ